MMKIYDISQEVLTCQVYPGDPKPIKNTIASIENGDVCNLTEFSMCAHNGTHVDAPFHFFSEGKTIDNMEIESFVGYCYVAEHSGIIYADDITNIISEARASHPECEKRILIKGKAVLSDEAAVVLSENNILLFGNESQTVGPEQAPMSVHKILLSKNVALLEGIRLQSVTEGSYILCAAPINLGGSDGAPCRAILIQI